MRIKPHKSRILVNFPDVGLKESWSPEQLKTLFQHKPNTEILDVNYVYLDLIHNFLKVNFIKYSKIIEILFLSIYFFTDYGQLFSPLFTSKNEICPIYTTNTLSGYWGDFCN